MNETTAGRRLDSFAAAAAAAAAAAVLLNRRVLTHSFLAGSLDDQYERLMSNYATGTFPLAFSELQTDVPHVEGAQ
jgi:hypothetical protein